MDLIRVLIVEDDPMVAELNRHYLCQLEGFSLAGIVTNGEEALQFLEKEKVELILLDIFMPHIDGMELLGRIRTVGRGVDVIMVTAARNSQYIQKALRYGVVDYVVKPFDFQRFQSSLVAYRERIRLLAESNLLNQGDIDRRILAKGESPAGEVPKGLARETLVTLIAWLEKSEQPFTTEQMAQQMGLSRVSLRKYLDYLKECGVLEAKLTYRSVGRPVIIYRYTKKFITF